MKIRIFRPLACAVGLALASTGAVASTNTFDTSELGPVASACTDLDAFVNAKWVATHPIPADHTSWGSREVLREESLKVQHRLVEQAAATASTATTGSIEQKIGYLYASGMDELAIERAGFDPIKPQLALIDALKRNSDIPGYIRDRHAQGESVLFRFFNNPDLKNSSREIAYVGQGGLTLPTPDYYSKSEYAEIRDAYVTHIAKLFELTGIPATQAAKQAKWVLTLETRLAAVSLTPVQMRQPENLYDYVDFAEAAKRAPSFNWPTFFKAQGADVSGGFSLSQPKFFAEVEKMLTDLPLSHWQAYLRYHAIEHASGYLSKAFQQEDFAFNRQTLNGQKEIGPRWKRVLNVVNQGMGMALGELYVADRFSPESKRHAEELVANLKAAFKIRIEQLEWMSDETKQKALKKLASFVTKIGYPDKWRDWSGLTLQPNSYYANVQAARKFNYDYNIAKIGKPTDRSAWGMTPQTVSAYNSAPMNEIVFPAAILQPPFFDAKADDAINYGAIGAVIGHEMSHSYDDVGSKFDAEGNNVNWWTSTDRTAFDARTAKLRAQFDGYEALPGKFVNGQLTLGENIGDLGGLNAAYSALQIALSKNPTEATRKIDGYTQDQRFFMSWARIYRKSIRPEAQLTLLNIDPHSPYRFRAIGAPSNMPEFARAFQCKSGDAMVRDGEKQVKIW